MAAPTPRAATFTVQTFNSTTIPATIPGNVANGELLVLVAGIDAASDLSAPAGWTLVQGGPFMSVGSGSVWTKTWLTGDPMTVTVTSTISERMTAAVLPISGHNGVDVSATTETGTHPWVCPSITTTVNDTHVLRIVVEELNDPVTHSHGSLTAWGQSGGASGAWVSIWGANKSTAGSTGTATITSTVTNRDVRTFTIAIRPASTEQNETGGNTRTVNVTGSGSGLVDMSGGGGGEPAPGLWETWDQNVDGWVGVDNTLTHHTSDFRHGSGAMSMQKSFGLTGYDSVRTYKIVNLGNVTSYGPQLGVWVKIPSGASGNDWHTRIGIYNSAGSFTEQSTSGGTRLVKGQWTFCTWTPDPALLQDVGRWRIRIGGYDIDGSTEQVLVDSLMQGTNLTGELPSGGEPPPDTTAPQLVFGTSADHLPLPRQLTWFAEGRWWGIFRKSSGDGSGWRVWKRNTDGVWVYSSEVLGTDGAPKFSVARAASNGNVYAHMASTTQSVLFRLVYNTTTNFFEVATQANVDTAYSGESSNVAIDSLNRVWIVTGENSRVTYSIRMAQTLGLIRAKTITTHEAVSTSVSVVAFTDSVGPSIAITAGTDITTDETYALIQRDSNPVGTFTKEVIDNRAGTSDGWVNVGAHTDGRLAVVWKSGIDAIGQPIIYVARRNVTGTWSAPVGAVNATSTSSSENPRRPRVAIDSTNSIVHIAVEQTASSGTSMAIYHTSADLATLSFGSVTNLFESGDNIDGYTFTDVHVGKGPFTSETGILWLARGREIIAGVLGSFSLWDAVTGIEGDGTGEPPGDIVTYDYAGNRMFWNYSNQFDIEVEQGTVWVDGHPNNGWGIPIVSFERVRYWNGSAYVEEAPGGTATDADAIIPLNVASTGTDSNGNYVVLVEGGGRIYLGTPTSGEYVPANTVGNGYIHTV